MADLVRIIKLSDNVVVPPKKVPNAVTSLLAAYDSGTLYNISWIDNDNVATHYDIEHSLNSDFSVVNNFTVTGGPPSSFYEQINLSGSSGLTRYFRVKARNISGSSPWLAYTFSPSPSIPTP